MPKKCPSCKGTGYDVCYGSKSNCPYCYGLGKIDKNHILKNRLPMETYRVDQDDFQRGIK